MNLCVSKLLCLVIVEYIKCCVYKLWYISMDFCIYEVSSKKSSMSIATAIDIVLMRKLHRKWPSVCQGYMSDNTQNLNYKTFSTTRFIITTLGAIMQYKICWNLAALYAHEHKHTHIHVYIKYRLAYRYIYECIHLCTYISP